MAKSIKRDLAGTRATKYILYVKLVIEVIIIVALITSQIDYESHRTIKLPAIFTYEVSS